MAFKKFSPMRFTAATEEAAVEGALQLVGATRDEVDYDFISETAKGVTVRVRPHDENALVAPIAPATEDADEPLDDQPLDSEMLDGEMLDGETGILGDGPLNAGGFESSPTGELEADLDEAENEMSEGDFSEGEISEEDFSDDEVSDDELDFDAELELEGDEYDEDETEAEDEEESGEEEPEIELDAALVERALTLARAMLGKMGLEAQVEVGRNRAPATVPLSIEGEDVGILIGKFGATLQSFQYVMNLTLNNGGEDEENRLRVAVDAGNYRARRQESLEAVARGAAQRARREGRPIKLEPMPSNERRIVHDVLQSEPGVSTQSEGREPHRCIIVAPGAGASNAGAEPRSHRGGARGMGGYGRGSRGGGRGRR